MSSDVRRIVEQGPLGVRTFEEFVQACLERAAAGDPEAVSLFVFAKIVQPFSDYYSDQALSAGRAVEFRDRLLSSLAAHDAAETLEEKQAVLRDAIRAGLNDGAR